MKPETRHEDYCFVWPYIQVLVHLQYQHVLPEQVDHELEECGHHGVVKAPVEVPLNRLAIFVAKRRWSTEENRHL